MTGTIADLIAWAVALILITGAAGKLLDRQDFALAVEAYELLPERLVPAFALGFPAAELAAGLLLAPGATRTVGIVVALAVLLAATSAVVVNLLRGRRVINCGCGGLSGRQPISWWLVARNALLAATVVAAARIPDVPLDVTALILGPFALLLVCGAADQLLTNALRQAALRGPA
jgi:hypothetical protein